MTATTSRFPQGSSTVVGYFANGEDAHRAIHALLNDGFEATQIGAAFNTSNYGSSNEAGRSSESPASYGKSVSYPDLEPSDAGLNISAAETADDYTSVTPTLGGGTGTGMAGAGKPGPITGSDLSHLNLPHEIKSTLAPDRPGETPLYTPPGTGDFSASHTDHPSWLEKLSHVFGGKRKHEADSDLVNATSQNFGTGEGHLGITPEAAAGYRNNYSRPYSHSAFESSFTGLGLPEIQSRHLAHRLAHGGAVVMVGVTGRIVEAEKILEQHNGSVRFAGEPFTDVLPAGDHRVAVFGAVDDVYPATEEVAVPTTPALQSR
jgi:hypothetical protein